VSEFERRARWLHVARELRDNPDAVIACPERTDGFLTVERLHPDALGHGGEFYVRCPACGVEQYLPAS
jgi:hypothetical protein